MTRTRPPGWGRSTAPTSGPAVTARPVSSRTSRTSACWSVSPGSILPPGSDQRPASGSWPRLMSRIRSPSVTMAPTQGMRSSAMAQVSSEYPRATWTGCLTCALVPFNVGVHEDGSHLPRCGGPLTEPSPWASGWRCALHGEVYPLRSPYSPSGDGLRGLLRNAMVPVWVPWPLPVGWLVTGFAGAGDDRTGTRACVAALSGPNPVGGPGEMLLISEEPGVGLGAHLAGLPGPDPG